MNLKLLETGNFKLDGGAIFGVVPKSLWSKVYPCDENNMCNLSMRCLLVESDDRLILVDTGIGRKQSEKFFSFYFLNGEHTLHNSLNESGYVPSDITDVLLTHLHFDHCGGAVESDVNGNLFPTFPNADYWVSKPQWDWALNPNAREKASFLQENFMVLRQSAKLRFIDTDSAFTKDIYLRLYNGHSQGLIIPFIKIGGKILVYTSDLLPTAAHIPVPWVCGYDINPLISLQEKDTFTREAFQKDYVLLFEHDIYHECCTLKNTEKGIRMDQYFTFQEFVNTLS